MNLETNYIKNRERWSDSDFVEGFNKKPIPKSKAIKISGKYYEKEVTALFIRETWYSTEDSNLTKDHYTGKLDHKHFLKNVYINKGRQTGHVSTNCPTVVCKTDAGAWEFINEKVANEAGFEECLNSGQFFQKGVKSPYYDHKINQSFFNHSQKLQKKVGVPEQGIPHNTRFGMASHTFIKSEGKEFTFGVELETAQGGIPKHIYLDQLNLSAVRDGSITGPELVTGILKGDQGLLHLRKICKAAYKRCDVDEKCGKMYATLNSNI